MARFRFPFAIACSIGSLLASSTAARADTSCSGIGVVDVIETAPGVFTPVGEWCYERGPGVPFYFDAPTELRRVRDRQLESFRAVQSMTHFEASELQALGAISMDEVIGPIVLDPLPPDFRPE